MSKKQVQMERMEDAATELLYIAEHWSLTGATLHDTKIRRRQLFEAARRYGRAVDAVARIRTE